MKPAPKQLASSDLVGGPYRTDSSRTVPTEADIDALTLTRLKAREATDDHVHEQVLAGNPPQAFQSPESTQLTDMWKLINAIPGIHQALIEANQGEQLNKILLTALRKQARILLEKKANEGVDLEEALNDVCGRAETEILKRKGQITFIEIRHILDGMLERHSKGGDQWPMVKGAIDNIEQQYRDSLRRVVEPFAPDGIHLRFGSNECTEPQQICIDLVEATSAHAGLDLQQVYAEESGMIPSQQPEIAAELKRVLALPAIQNLLKTELAAYLVQCEIEGRVMTVLHDGKERDIKPQQLQQYLLQHRVDTDLMPDSYLAKEFMGAFRTVGIHGSVSMLTLTLYLILKDSAWLVTESSEAALICLVLVAITLWYEERLLKKKLQACQTIVNEQGISAETQDIAIILANIMVIQQGVQSRSKAAGAPPSSPGTAQENEKMLLLIEAMHNLAMERAKTLKPEEGGVDPIHHANVPAFDVAGLRAFQKPPKRALPSKSKMPQLAEGAGGKEQGDAVDEVVDDARLAAQLAEVIGAEGGRVADGIADQPSDGAFTMPITRQSVADGAVAQQEQLEEAQQVAEEADDALANQERHEVATA